MNKGTPSAYEIAVMYSITDYPNATQAQLARAEEIYNRANEAGMFQDTSALGAP